ncbi:MAG: heme exporter protein CcmB [Phycisphaerales bacterium]|nr:heme exporter protein CcmB [Phycisphaerales bacterium]
MSGARAIAALASKDLRIETRSREMVTLVAMLGVLVVVVLALGLGPEAAGPRAAAILWVAYLFSGVICFEKTMQVERQDDALAALLLAPVDRGQIYLAKLLANLVLMTGTGLVITVAGVLFFRFDLAAWGFAGVMALGLIGFAAVGTLFSACSSSSRLGGGVLPLLVFPLCLPLILASTQMVLAMHEPERTVSGGYGVLVAFDIVFLAAGWLAFEFLLEP